MGYLPLRALPRLEPPAVDRRWSSDLTITGNPESSCSVASDRVAYCLGTASGSEGFDRVSALRELVEERSPWCPSVGECHPSWTPSPGRSLLRLAMH
jgi:hypothetical protein